MVNFIESVLPSSVFVSDATVKNGDATVFLCVLPESVTIDGETKQIAFGVTISGLEQRQFSNESIKQMIKSRALIAYDQAIKLLSTH